MSRELVVSAMVLLFQPFCWIQVKDVCFISVVHSVLQVWLAGQEPHGDVGMKKTVERGGMARHEDEDVCGVSSLEMMLVATSDCFVQVFHHIDCSTLMDEREVEEWEEI